MNEAQQHLALVLLLIGAIIYFIPSVVAWRREHRNLAPIFVINLFLGWTLIGWVGALAWALMNNESR